VHCSAFLVGGLKRAPQIFFLNFFVWVVLFGHNYGPVNQKKTHQNFSCKVEKSTSICAIDLAVQHMWCEDIARIANVVLCELSEISHLLRCFKLTVCHFMASGYATLQLCFQLADKRVIDNVLSIYHTSVLG